MKNLINLNPLDRRRQKASLALYRAQQGLIDAMRHLEGTEAAEALYELLKRLAEIKRELGE